MQYGQNDDLVKPNVYIYSRGFQGILICIFLSFLQIHANFGSLIEFLEI
jgi:hypothetical protein